MPRNWLGSWVALLILISISGCGTVCDKYCSRQQVAQVAYVQPAGAPVCCQPVCQPVCCQPVTTAPPPATTQPPPNWQNPTAHGYYYDPCASAP
jgi:hypothetical protein